MKQLIPILLFAIACRPVEVKIDPVAPTKGVETILDEWHKAAATGKYEKYFSYFEDSTSIFIGTDATERWTVSVFAPWAKPAFEDGMAWDFTPFNRVVYYSADSTFAWFDEELDTPNLGLCRGSGVLKVVGGEWKIAHYNLAVPVPNEIVYDVRDQIRALDSVKSKVD